MRDYLLFRLYGPMSAWGDIAVGEFRPSFAHPSKSAILGLIAAALGLRRDREEEHRNLAESYRFAVRIDVMGNLLRDYHTAQVPPAQKGIIHATRRSELESSSLNTILSTRDYREDAVYAVVLWTISTNCSYSLANLVEALRKPMFTLYLGRKSCPPALPLQPQIVSAPSLKDALEAGVFKDAEFLGDLFLTGLSPVYWEEDGLSGYTAQHVITRRDDPISRQRWQFAERREHYTALVQEKKD
jgi:CRISPR system Cascade subunit CasD